MAIELFSKLDDWEVTRGGQDVIEWQVKDGAKNVIGYVRDMLVDTDAGQVVALVLDTGEEVPIRKAVLDNGVVFVPGVRTAVHASETNQASEINYDRQARDSSAARTEAGRPPSTNTYRAEAERAGQPIEGEIALPVIEEQLRVGKRQVERGGVRVSTHVIEQPVEENVRLREEHINVERRPADRPAGETELTAFQEGVIEVSEVKEELVVDKQARVVEEVVVSKEVTERDEMVRETVRRTEVEVESLEADAAGRRHR